MGETKILACETLKAELMRVMREENCDYPIIWIESGLHDVPKKLHRRLQEEIDKVTDCSRLILFFGRCGNAVEGLRAGDFEMIVPKLADCISLLWGSDEERNKFGTENAAYYLTEGWMRGERNIWVTYVQMVEKYGQETADEIAGIMYNHYRTLALLDSGTEPIEHLYEETEPIEEKLHLKRRIVPVRLDLLHTLLKGPWDEKYFDIVEPGDTLEFFYKELSS